ncbi:MAG: type II/IV secretion system ATPase subunit [Desulfurococcales archaeon]|nr:type II/IV secretion system ATPase subunit [Desulfurococcales archaeon]
MNPLQKFFQKISRSQVSSKHSPPREPLGEDAIAIPPSSLRIHYRHGPVEYYVYSDDEGFPRLKIVEPKEPPADRIAEIIAGLEEPANEVETYYARKKTSGYGKLYPLVIDDNIEEIAVDGPGRHVSVIHRLIPGYWIDVDLTLGEADLDSIAIQLARKAGRIVSLATPYAEGITTDGHRIAVTIGREITRHGTTIVLRKYPDKPLTIVDLLATRVITPLAAAYLWILIEAHSFIMIIGGMGAGKTTLLQALSGLIPPHHRIVTIEDTPEIRLYHRHWDSLVTRPRIPGEEIEDIGLEDLLRFALRRRADHVIVGEVRGREARLLAQAAASGHGSITTFHADSAEAAILRLRLDPINLPPLFLKIITSFVHVRRIPVLGGGFLRRVTSIVEIQDDELTPVFEWNPSIDKILPDKASEVVERSEALRNAWINLGLPSGSLEAELDERARFLEERINLPRETFMASLAKFYAEKYGVTS